MAGTWSSAGSPGVAARQAFPLRLPDGRVVVVDAGAIYLSTDASLTSWATYAFPGTYGISALVTGPSGVLLSVSGGGDLLVPACDAGNNLGIRFNFGTLSWTTCDNATNGIPAIVAGEGVQGLFQMPDGRAVLIRDWHTFSHATSIYDPGTNQWSDGPVPNVPRTAGPVAQLSDGRVVMAGGMAAGFVETLTIEILDAGATAWTLSAASLSYCHQLGWAVAMQGDVVAIIGGRLGDNSDALDAVEKYDPGLDAVTPGASMSAKRSSFGACLVESDLLLVAGGYVPIDPGDSDDYSTAACEVYSLVHDGWSSTGSMATPRAEVFLVKTDVDAAWVFGGVDYQGAGRDQQSTAEAWGIVPPDLTRYLPPLTEPSPPTPADAKEAALGEDLLFQDGDFPLTADGDYATTSGDEVAVQEVLQCLSVSPGEYRLHPSYGVGVTDYLKRPVTRATVAELQERVKERVPVDCPSVDSVESAVVESVTVGPKTGLRVTVAFKTRGRVVRPSPFTFFLTEGA